MTALHLVACVKEKRCEPAPAADLYLSTWFRKARAYVEGQNAPWFVLSARHGLLDPRETIAPYDQTLLRMSPADRHAWGEMVLGQLARLTYPADAPVVVLAGIRYREPLQAWLGNRAIIPMAGMPIGRQLAWLTSQVNQAMA
jgi:hypothetical protein